MKKILTVLLLFIVSTSIALGDGLKKIEILEDGKSQMVR